MFTEKQWGDLAKELESRHSVLSTLVDKLNAKEFDHSKELAATDIFVEKAQVYLTERARFLARMGTINSVLVLIIFLVPAIYLSNHQLLPNDIIFNSKQKNISTLSTQELITINIDNGYLFSLIVLRNTTIGGAIIAAAVYLIHISRACFHESTILYNRRHALRFGRLYIYLKMSGYNFDLKDLESAFKWSDEFSTAFKDIKPESIAPNNIIQGFADIASKTMDVSKEAIRNIVQDKKNK
ncbi:MAG: hypothetical protein WCK85_06830 [Chlorobium sp.]